MDSAPGSVGRRFVLDRAMPTRCAGHFASLRTLPHPTPNECLGTGFGAGLGLASMKCNRRTDHVFRSELSVNIAFIR